ncbi:LacI family transcriptional regulator [Butyricicoccus faecihominis]|uniref:LacI family DNA-binding transcriptional regulator n=1 Tax=Butyricicoccus faecihominis TaxID=1712515 RepID=UPI00247AA6F8|nr:LacI family DNA-binding transcriptional regulator [Butyricicoccus faecihominis]MCQ5130472.1 LacI family transcriptional regulator [Butyricicoccus faecihominis]
MRVTIRDIAQASGYTVATISRALNNNALVSEKTRRHIRDIADQMGYVRTPTAESTVAPVIGIVVPDITNPYFPPLIQGAQDTLRAAGYSLVLCNSAGKLQNEVEAMQTLTNLEICGMIMDPLSDDSYRNLRQINESVPVVFISNRPKGPNLHYISIDNYAAAAMATNYLVSLGHHRIAYIGSDDATYTYHERRRGFIEAMERHFGSDQESPLLTVYPDRRGGFEATNHILTCGSELPTAFFASNDCIALGILEYLWMHGFRVPEDISVIGIDNIEYSSMPRINLTTIEEPRYHLGELAAQAILQVLHRSAEDKTPIQQVIEPRLIIRNTCGKL